MEKNPITLWGAL